MKILQNGYIKSLLIIFLTILAVVFIIMYIKSNNDFYQVKNEYERKIEKFKKEKKELIAEFNAKRKITISNKNIIALDSSVINEMKDKGLMDPVQDIISDLQKHS